MSGEPWAEGITAVPTATGAPVPELGGFVALAGIAERAITWWWRGRLAVGMVTVMAGGGGAGKSTWPTTWPPA